MYLNSCRSLAGRHTMVVTGCKFCWQAMACATCAHSTLDWFPARDVVGCVEVHRLAARAPHFPNCNFCWKLLVCVSLGVPGLANKEVMLPAAYLLFHTAHFG